MDAMTEKVEQLRQLLDEADAVLVGAGAGLSTAAGFTYTGPRLLRYFPDFVDRYGFSDMYSGGFYPFPTPEEHWAYWSRYIYINRYMDAPNPVYERLLRLVRDKDYFVITTNVDHCFQKAGIDRQRLFYTQGDYGLWQCSVPCHESTYDNAETVQAMVRAQGFTIADYRALLVPDDLDDLSRSVPSDLVPHCPRCGAPMAMNLRADGTFVEDGGWHQASERYRDYCISHRDGPLVLMEIGVGYNTPGIIKYPFWAMTAQNPHITYVLINKDDTNCPSGIADQTLTCQMDVASLIVALEQ